MWLSSNGSEEIESTIQAKVERILAGRQITRRDHLDLTSVLLASKFISDRDRLLINQILEHIQLGKLKLMD